MEQPSETTSQQAPHSHKPINPFNWIVRLAVFGLFAGAVLATERYPKAQEFFLAIHDFIKPHHAIAFPMLAALAALTVWGIHGVAMKTTQPRQMSRFVAGAFYAVVVVTLLTASVGTAVGGAILAQRASDTASQQRTTDLVSVMTPYEKDAYSAYKHHKQNPTESFVTDKGTHVGVVGVDGCAVMWNDSIELPETVTGDKLDLGNIVDYQATINRDVNDAGFTGFYQRWLTGGLELKSGHVLSAQGCPKSLGSVDVDAIKSDVAKSAK